MKSDYSVYRVASKDSVGPKEGFYKALKKEVLEYLKINNQPQRGGKKMVLKCAIIFTIWITSYIFTLYMGSINPWYMFFGLAPMAFSSCFMQLGIMHDGSHKTVSESKKMNTFAAWTLGLAGASPFTWYQLHCVSHHNHTNIYKMDMDTETGDLVRLHVGNPRYGYQRYQHIYAWFLYHFHTLRYLLFDDIYEYLINYWHLSKPDLRRCLHEIVLVKSWHVSAYIIIPILITGSFKVVFLYYLAHFMGLSFFITTIFLMAHVTNVQKLPMSKKDTPKDWAIRQLETTADFAVNNKFLGWAIGGLNFQVEHHIFPNICSIHYPAIQKIVKRMSKEWNINYHEAPTIWSAVKGHYFHLKRLGTTDTGSTPACAWRITNCR